MSPTALGAHASQGGDVPGRRRAARACRRLAGALWASLALEQRRIGGVDAVVAGYPYMPDALPAWVFARGRRVPLVADALISMPDTLAGDRARVGAGAGRALAALDTASLRCADVVIADTDAHARFYEERFGVARERLGVARVRHEAAVFRPAAPPPGRPRRSSTESSRRCTVSTRCSRPRGCRARRRCA